MTDRYNDIFEYAEKQKVKTSDWKPSHAPLDYPDAFYKWVCSINSGWRNMSRYEPFELYVKQAEQWLADKDDILNYEDAESQEDYLFQEYVRCEENTLYFANKYGQIKDGDLDGGGMPYKAWKAQQIILFLLDCGYNLMIGKARQIGFTTTLGLAANKRIIFKDSYFVKFLTATELKGKEIFRDKIRWAFGKVPGWLREEVYNDAANVLSLEDKSNKGESEGKFSRIEVSAPAIDAINGGSPNLVLIDEIGLFEIFGQMMQEGRPTLYQSIGGKMVMKRQLLCWGTGGEMDKGGSVFESEFKAAIEAWRKKNFSYAIIPLFFDAYAREGMTDELYENERIAYYSKTGVEGEKSRVQFHQHFPLTLDDMFLRKSRTIIPVAECNKHLMRIYNNKNQQPQFGYFEPVYDKNRPLQDSVVPFKLVGAVWVPTGSETDDRTTAMVWEHPPHGEKWDYRYYQGTDPINSQTGHSKMSSTIWDAYKGTVSSVVFWRTRLFRECYLQCLLQGLYYDQVNLGGVKELIESNIGDGYFEFQELAGYDRRVVANASLPLPLQTPSGKWFGINNKTNTAAIISNRIIEMVEAYSEQINVPWLFVQLKTFVEKDLKTTDSQRQTRYQAADTKRDFDDVIFSMVFAYINAQAHSRYEPTRVDEQVDSKTEIRYVQNKDTGFKVRRAVVNKQSGKVIRFLGIGR